MLRLCHATFVPAIIFYIILTGLLSSGGCRNDDKGKDDLMMLLMPPAGYIGGCGSWTETSTDGELPAGRNEHTAVWTGTEMIVWGGSDGGTCLGSGGVYDPAADSWTATSTGASCPSGRHYHTAVAADTNMIIWGGSAYSGFFKNDGGIYDPDTDSWTQTDNGANCPVGRDFPTSVWTGDSMIVWGGYRIDWGNSTSVYENTGGIYEPLADTWTPTSTLGNCPDGRTDHTAVWTGSKMIIWGGEIQAGSFSVLVNTGAVYDPLSDTWTPTSTETNCPCPRFFHTALWVANRMIIWGGYADAFGWLNDGAMYDPETDTWTPISTGARCPLKRYGYSAVSTGDKMIIWGGVGPPFWMTPPYNGGAIYDPATDTWILTYAGFGNPRGRVEHTAVWTGTSMIVWGGCIYNGTFDGRDNTGGIFTP